MACAFNLTQDYVTVGKLKIGNKLPITLIAGPCLLESRSHAMEVAESLVSTTRALGMGLIFKTSFDKANRTSSQSKRGMGLTEALPVFADIRETFDIPVVTDVHEVSQCKPVAEVVDVLQIPAFLCRQTDLVQEAARTGCAVNIKKGQFLAPWDMQHIAQKALETGNQRILLCERGVSFGYNTLVSDMRSLPILEQTGLPVVFDATHSVQQPGGMGGSSGGQREFVEPLARAAVAIGVAALFIETHPDPDHAPSDGPNMVPLKNMGQLLNTLKTLDAHAKSIPYAPFSVKGI